MDNFDKLESDLDFEVGGVTLKTILIDWSQIQKY